MERLQMDKGGVDITLDDAKTHLNVALDFVLDDGYIQGLIETAIAIVVSDCNKSIEELRDDEGNFNRIARHAALLRIGDMYAFRESVVTGSAMALPGGYQQLISLIKKY